MAALRLLLIGATGYIGGAVLKRFLSSSLPEIRDLSISVLVRQKAQAESLASLGVNSILFKDLDDLELLKSVASEHDVVIHCGSGSHMGSSEALIAGLSERKNHTNKPTFFFRTSGTSDLADRPISKRFIETREFSDKDDIHEYLQYRQSIEVWPQRAADLSVVAAGEAAGVNTYIIMSPLVYGRGDGPFNQTSMQIPWIAKAALKWGYTGYIGTGTSEFDHVHILDLAALYELLTARVLSGADVPTGKRGIFFSATGRHTWLELAQGVGRAGVELGRLKSETPKNVPLEQAAQEWAMGLVDYVEVGFGSRATTKSDLAREMGWEPQKTTRDWQENFLQDFKDVLAEHQG